MTDIVTYCDVNTCEDCQRYGDDCDGDKRVEHTDLISRADAIDAVKDTILKRFNLADWYEEMLNCGVEIEDRINALPSADAEYADLPDIPRAYYERIVGKMAHEINMLKEQLESADAVQGWIPLNKQKSFLMMPDELVAVNVTWVNHIAPPYYKHIEDVPFVDTAVYYRGKWYWWDATVIDVLAEYGENCNAEQIDKDIEILAWMPLPTPYKGGDTE